MRVPDTPNTSPDAADVIFVQGSARSGSTFLAQALATHPDCFAAGEICNVWRHWLAGGTCSCGAEVGVCALWGPVLTGALAEAGLASPADAEALRLSAARTRHRMLRRLPGRRTTLDLRWEAYVRLLAEVYRGLRDATGCATIVDTSKKPVDAEAAQSAASVYFVHLVRDPLAVAASERRRHPADLPARELPFVKSVVRSAIDWSWLNAMAARNARRAGPANASRLVYEALVEDLRGSLAAVTAAAGLGEFDWPLASGRALFAAGHIVNGNPARFNTGWVEIRTTKRSGPPLTLVERVLVAAITFPAARSMRRAARR